MTLMPVSKDFGVATSWLNPGGRGRWIGYLALSLTGRLADQGLAQDVEEAAEEFRRRQGR